MNDWEVVDSDGFAVADDDPRAVEILEDETIWVAAENRLLKDNDLSRDDVEVYRPW